MRWREVILVVVLIVLALVMMGLWQWLREKMWRGK